jgi:hypothetical protein
LRICFFKHGETHPVHRKACVCGCIVSSLSKINEKCQRNDCKRPKRGHFERV